MSKRICTDNILKIKYLIRKNIRRRNNMLNTVSMLQVGKKKLSINIFNKSKIKNIDASINEIQKGIDGLSESSRNYSFLLLDCIRHYDKFTVTKHETAQLLNISHVAFDKFLEGEHSGDGSLMMSGAMGAETFDGNEDFIGESSARDNPIFEATQLGVMKALHENKEFSDFASNMFEEMFGPFTKYQKIDYPDGTSEMVRIPPDLKVIDGVPHE